MPDSMGSVTKKIMPSTVPTIQFPGLGKDLIKNGMPNTAATTHTPMRNPSNATRLLSALVR